MYSQQWAPAPSITAITPELRTANRSPARPAANSLPAVAPCSVVLPRTTCWSVPPAAAASRNGRITRWQADVAVPLGAPAGDARAHREVVVADVVHAGERAAGVEPRRERLEYLVV